MANRIFITGDFHGGHDSHKLTTDAFPEQKYLDKSDVVIILGDVGIYWDGSKTDKYWQQWLEEKPWTTVCVLGNHENYDLIEQLPVVEKFGTKCWQSSPSVYFIQHGEIAEINGYTFWCMNGAASHDLWCRTAGLNWWPDKEIPDNSKLSHGIDVLEDYGKEHMYVDYIITHTAPTPIHAWLTRDIDTRGNKLTQYLEMIRENYSYKGWFFGHYHFDCRVDAKHICLYNEVMELTPSVHKMFHMNCWDKDSWKENNGLSTT